VVPRSLRAEGTTNLTSVVQSENEALNQRVVDAVKMSGKLQEAQQGHTVDWIASEFEQVFDGMDTERRRKVKFLSDQDRLVRHLEMELVLAAKNRVRVRDQTAALATAST